MSNDHRNDAIIDLTPMRDLDPLTHEELMTLVPWTVEITTPQPEPRRRRAAILLASSAAVFIAMIAAALLVMSAVSGQGEHRMAAAAAIAPPFSSVMPAAVPIPQKKQKKPPEGKAREAMAEEGEAAGALLSSPVPPPPPPSRRTAAKRRIRKPRPVRHPDITEVIRKPRRPTIEELIGNAAVKLPLMLSKRQIVGAMMKVVPRVRKCRDRFHVPGVADVSFRILHDGTISRLKVAGIFAGTPTGACVLEAVERARFPEFLSPSMTIRYPFVLR